MRTKSQKQEDIAGLKKAISASQSLVFCDFKGVPTASIQKLKHVLKTGGAMYRVTKKRLLRLVLKDLGIALDPKTEFKEQLSTVFASGDILSVASTMYKFSRDLAKEKKEFKVLGGYDIAGKAIISSEQFMMLAKLPNRETLLAQLVGMLAAPIRALLFVLKEVSNRTPAPATVAAGDAKTVEEIKV